MAVQSRNPQQDKAVAGATSTVAKPRHRAAVLLLFCTTALVAPQADAAGITEIGGLGQQDAGALVRTSADGSIIVGWTLDDNTGSLHAVRWTQADGLFNLGTLNGGSSSSAGGVSADGSVIVGASRDGAAGGLYRAFRWTEGGGMVSLGTLNGGLESNAAAVSGDGSVIVGYAHDGSANNMYRAFRWTAATGIVSLGTLNGGSSSSASDISADGSVIVGDSADGSAGNEVRAFRWTQASGMVSLGTLNGGVSSSANAVSGDGSVVVGWANDGAAGNNARAFRWAQTTGMVSLGVLGGGTSSYAYGTNTDGSVIVGTADQNSTYRAFRWTQSTGMITVEQWLRNAGVAIPTDMTYRAYGVSSDGNVVVGMLPNNHPFIARGPVPVPSSPTASNTTPATTPAGLMDVTNFQQSLVSTPRVSGQMQNADVAINGAHSSPLFMLLDAGQSSAWFTGDGGYASTTTAQGGLGAGEFGFGRGLDDGWTVRLAGGGQYARMDTPNGGNSVFSSGYVAPDVSLAFDGGLVATLSGYFNWGKADIRRSYLNGTANDSSFGSAATQTYGVRARIDWEDAFKLASTGVSPFVSYTYLNSQVNGNTETGGSFPVRFEGMREISNAIRIGADAKTPLNDQLALVTRFEYGHRFEKAGAGVSGQILGLSAFSIDGAPVQQDWVRGGIGLSYKLGDGDGLVMLNTSNQTGRNVTWLSASYRVKF